MPMLVPTSSGIALQLQQEQLILDGRGDLVFISHAHSDHSSGAKKSKRLISSPETIDLMHSRNYADSQAMQKKLVSTADFNYELLDAGHVLGSKQLHISNGFSFTYTGDFKTKDSLTNKGAEIRQADTLLMECTYGLPYYKFPDPTDVYAEMEKWVDLQLKEGSSIIIGGYALGKAQEVIKILNDYCDVTPIVSSEIFKISNVYLKHGINLKFINETSDEAKQILKKQFVAVVPHHFANYGYAGRLSEFYGMPVRSAVATGWALGARYAVDKAFCISDHCDFPDLMEFVEQVAPERIITTHGYEKEFARELTKRGYDAQPLGNLKPKKQKLLLQY